jgi:hypothetical protein
VLSLESTYLLLRRTKFSALELPSTCFGVSLHGARGVVVGLYPMKASNLLRQCSHGICVWSKCRNPVLQIHRKAPDQAQQGAHPRSHHQRQVFFLSMQAIEVFQRIFAMAPHHAVQSFSGQFFSGCVVTLNRHQNFLHHAHVRARAQALAKASSEAQIVRRADGLHPRQAPVCLRLHISFSTTR